MDALVVPVGGGGMVAGIAITIKVRKLLKDFLNYYLYHTALWTVSHHAPNYSSVASFASLSFYI